MTLVPPSEKQSTTETAAVHAGGRGWSMKILATLAMLGLLSIANGASALTLSGGPVYSLPGGGSCSVSGNPAGTGGAVVTCSGVNLGAHVAVYFGIRNDTHVNGNATDGNGPSSGEVFSFSSAVGTTLTYTSSSSITDNQTGHSSPVAVNNSLVLTLVSGSATVVAAGGNPADSGTNGAIQRLYQIIGGTSFQIGVNVQASNTYHVLGNALPAVFDPTLTPTPGGGDISGVDLAFYYYDCGNGNVDSGEQCDLGGANGLSTSCCSSTCQFTSGNTCRASGGTCDIAETCSGASATCPADAKSTAVCRGSAGACDLAEVCDGVSNNCPVGRQEYGGVPRCG